MGSTGSINSPNDFISVTKSFRDLNTCPPSWLAVVKPLSQYLNTGNPFAIRRKKFPGACRVWVHVFPYSLFLNYSLSCLFISELSVLAPALESCMHTVRKNCCDFLGAGYSLCFCQTCRICILNLWIQWISRGFQGIL